MRRHNPEAGLVVFWVKLMHRGQPHLCVKLQKFNSVIQTIFIAFCRGCCSISQRKNQQLGKILLKIYILNNAVKLDKYRYSNKWIVNYSQLLPHLKKMNRHESKMWKKYMQCLGIKKSVTPRKK